MKKILIRYCPIWDGYPEAAQSVSDELKDFNVNIEEGDRGEFTITCGDNIIFDKSKIDRFPNDNEIIKIIVGEQ